MLCEILDKIAAGKPLSFDERNMGLRLIANAKRSNHYCAICEISTAQGVAYAIFDTQVCADHAYFALMDEGEI